MLLRKVKSALVDYCKEAVVYAVFYQAIMRSTLLFALDSSFSVLLVLDTTGCIIPPRTYVRTGTVGTCIVVKARPLTARMLLRKRPKREDIQCMSIRTLYSIVDTIYP